MSKFLIRQNIDAYVAGEQPKDTGFIKLNTNENPYETPMPDTDTLLNVVKNLRNYSDTNFTALTEAFSKRYNVGKENIIFGNGSDEILAFCILAFSDTEHDIAYPEITYSFYKSLTALYGVKSDKIPLNEDFSINIADYFNKGKTVLIANPNAPTSLALSLDEIEQIIVNNKDNVVIIDEAYVSFGADSAMELTKKYDNLVVTGTFSKSRHLAGARLGYAVASQDLIADLESVRNSYNPYNVNSVSQMLGIVSLENDEYYRECTKKIIEAREMFKAGLLDLGFEVLNSKTNFVFTKHEKMSSAEIFKKLRENKILVRHLSGERTGDYLRISIGRYDEMETVLSVLKSILEVA